MLFLSANVEIPKPVFSECPALFENSREKTLYILSVSILLKQNECRIKGESIYIAKCQKLCQSCTVSIMLIQSELPNYLITKNSLNCTTLGKYATQHDWKNTIRNPSKEYEIFNSLYL